MSDLRFPIGAFTFPESVTPAQRTAHIAALRDLPAQLRAALADLPESHLETPYRPGGWSIRQTIHHIADSHMNSYIRFKLAVTEDVPTVKPYDEARWAELTDGKTGPIEWSLTLLDVLQPRWATFLESLSDADWQRSYRHPEQGLVRLDAALALYDWHGRHHVAHITALRARENF